jgi:uncharacterized PurR-regulated membrane protein YhhQ (DUF165 family)
MTRAVIVLIAYVGSVVVANWVTTSYGLVPAGFGLLVPAGTYAAGLALGLRDIMHDLVGAKRTVAAVGVAAAASFLVADPLIAVASAVAFLLSELADLAVYTPLRESGRRRALVASNAVGAVVDTLLFLWIAGFPLTGQSIGGQVLVKAVWCTAVVLAVREVARRVPRERQLTEGA